MFDAMKDVSTPGWSERSRQSVWHPCTQMKQHEQLPPRAIVSAEGPWLVDDAGHRILDAVSSWWVNLFGHGYAPIREAITDQLGRVDHIMLAGLTHPPVVELSERLGQLTGLGIGQSTCIGIGGDPIIGTTHTDAIKLFNEGHTELKLGRATPCRSILHCDSVLGGITRK